MCSNILLFQFRSFFKFGLNDARFLAKLTSCQFSGTSTSGACSLASRLAKFSVIETNTFKHIIHISLEFIAGNDAETKQYLAGLVKDFKSEIHQLTNKLQNTSTSLTSQLTGTESRAHALSSEIEKLKLSHMEALNAQTKLHADELVRMKEKHAEEKDSIREQHEKIRADYISKYDEQV